MYKCKQSYCIPYGKVCVNVKDCINGDDEDVCDNYTCVAMLVCKNHPLYVHPSEVCDGVVYCPYGDDESMCDINHCPYGCVCLALGIF